MKNILFIKLKLGLIAICLFLCFTRSQSQSVTNNGINIQLYRIDNEVRLNWYPTEVDDWVDLNNTGYQIIRVKIDNNGNAIGKAQVLLESALPKDSTWFSLHSNEANGMIAAVEALLFDEKFEYGTVEGTRDVDAKYNYIVYESLSSQELANAVGLGYVDSDINPEDSYKYIIKGNGTSLEGSITSMAKQRSFETNYTKAPNFTFLGGKSLSDMYFEGKSLDNYQLVSIAKAYEDSIVLRFVPPAVSEWPKLKNEGFEIYRSQNGSDKVLIANVKPVAFDDLDKEMLMNDSLAFIAAGLLYGEFDESNVEGFGNKANLDRNYFGMALLIAEQSSSAADILGLRYVDKNVVKNEKYNYTVSYKSLRLEKKYLEGFCTVENTYSQDAAPYGIKAISGNNSVKLTWNMNLNIHKFSSYMIETSDDGINYKPLFDRPLVFMDSGEAVFQKYSYIDSTNLENDVKYHYRLKGGNSFGEWSESAEVTGTPIDLNPPPSAKLYRVEWNDTLNLFDLYWRGSDVLAEDFSHYQVLMSDDELGQYTAVSEELDFSHNYYYFEVDRKYLAKRCYFKIISFDIEGNFSESNIISDNVPDIFAPEMPLGLEYSIDTLGFVTISWNKNTEDDLRGYWLYWANDPNNEMSRVSEDVLKNTSYTYYLEVKSLAKEIFYCVRAEDVSYNKSEPSEILVVKRLDVIAPIIPVVLPIKSEFGFLNIRWNPSPSDDVKKIEIFKNNDKGNVNSWVLLDTLGSDNLNLNDNQIQIQESVQYKLRVIDDSGNVSDFSNIVQGLLAFPSDSIFVKDLTISNNKKNTKLTWTYMNKISQLDGLPYQYVVYRETGNSGLDYLNTIDSLTTTFTDPDIQPNVLYNYAVRVKFDNGWTGALSEVKSILLTESNK